MNIIFKYSFLILSISIYAMEEHKESAIAFNKKFNVTQVTDPSASPKSRRKNQISVSSSDGTALTIDEVSDHRTANENHPYMFKMSLDKNNKNLFKKSFVGKKILDVHFSPNGRNVLYSTWTSDVISLETYFLDIKSADELKTMNLDALHKVIRARGLNPQITFDDDNKDTLISLIGDLQKYNFPHRELYHTWINVNTLQELGINIDDIHSVAVSNESNIDDLALTFALADKNKVILYQAFKKDEHLPLPKVEIVYQKPIKLLTTIQSICLTPSNDLEIKFKDNTKIIKWISGSKIKE